MKPFLPAQLLQMAVQKGGTKIESTCIDSLQSIRHNWRDENSLTFPIIFFHNARDITTSTTGRLLSLLFKRSKEYANAMSRFPIV
jgi:hypothetical protein